MLRETRQLRAIRNAFEQAGRPLSPAELHEHAARDVPELGLATVYRTISKLTEAGEIAPVELPGESPRYERREAADQHHHHFRCTCCDRVFDVHGCAHGVESLAPEGFEVEDHEITLTGRCADCAGAA
ncbi:MAG: transcriptional repressor [Planctomycetota bacterium]